MAYKIIPIREDFLLKARNESLDDQNQPVEHLIAQGGEPCRDVLRRALPGEKLILASYCPFSKTGPYKEYGPVFIMANNTAELPDLSQLPLSSGKETDYLVETFVIRAYSEQESIVDATLASKKDALSMVNHFFSMAEVQFILLRFAAYGCYSLRLDRG